MQMLHVGHTSTFSDIKLKTAHNDNGINKLTLCVTFLTGALSLSLSLSL